MFVTQGNATKFDPGSVKPATPKTLGIMLGKVLKAMRMRTVIGERGHYRNYEFKQAHGFRKFFKTRLEVGGVKPLVIETLMGHNTGPSKSYFKPTTKELAAEYAKAIRELTIVKEKEEADKHEMLVTMRRQILKFAHFTDLEIESLKADLGKVSDEEFQKIIDQKSLSSLGLNGNRQKLVPLGEVKNYIVLGWEYVSTLPDDVAVVRLPQ